MSVRMRQLLPLLVIAATAVACSKREPDGNTFTLATGVSVVDVKACTEGKPSTEGKQSSITVNKNASEYLVTAQGVFSCGAEIDPPYLTLERNGKATLVIKSSSTNSCECLQSVTVKIVSRLKTNDTLYVLANSEVAGHAVLP